MALYNNLSKTYKSLLLPSYSLFVKCIHKNIENRSVVLEVDAIDDFTTQLLQKQSSKWENLQAKSKELYQQRKNIFNPKNETNKSWDDAVEQKNVKDILELIRIYVENGVTVPIKNINIATQILAENGESEGILQLQRLCGEVYPEFEVHLAEAYWNQGDVTKSLNLFADIYKKSKILQRQINTTLKYLFLNIIRNRSEAVLLTVIKFCKDLHKNHQDLFLLAVVWQTCFLSEWFTDQNISFDLIEENVDLRKIVLLRMPFLASVALNNHQTEVVYRLLEFLLKHELKTEYSNILQCLFDYKSMLCKNIVLLFLIFFSCMCYSPTKRYTWLL